MASFKMNTSATQTPNDIKAIQQQLNSQGAGLAVDGIWGPKTQAAYNAYNTQNTYQPAPASTVAPGEVIIPKTRQDVLKGMVGYTGTNEYGLPSMPSVDIGAAYDDSMAQYKKALDAAYASQKADTESQAKKLAEQYNATRGQAYTTARLNAIGNNEQNAALGLGGNMYSAPRSGFSETSRVTENIAMRNNINAATLQENQQKDALALELVKAGYTRDSDYARYMAQALIDKANAQDNQSQNRFKNELTMYEMAQAAANEYNASHPTMSSGSYGGGGYYSSGGSMGGSSTGGSGGVGATAKGSTKTSIINGYISGETDPNTVIAQAMKANAAGTLDSAELQEIISMINYKSSVDKYADKIEAANKKTNSSGKGLNT